MKKSYEKVLTKNDTGETGGHQAGIVVPKKNAELLEFFPTLNVDEFNPDTWILCEDPDGEHWKFRYVYYNGKTFSPAKSTRNEYRITHMTKFFVKWGANSGDSVMFSYSEQFNHYKIQIKHRDEELKDTNSVREPQPVVLKGWRTVY